MLSKSAQPGKGDGSADHVPLSARSEAAQRLLTTCSKSSARFDIIGNHESHIGKVEFSVLQAVRQWQQPFYRVAGK